jgi:3,4-dihydroxy 2-butanone 4-phosphate synthase
VNQNLLTQFGNPIERVGKALNALQNGQGVLVTDDEEQMAMLIRECSGIDCLFVPS